MCARFAELLHFVEYDIIGGAHLELLALARQDLYAAHLFIQELNQPSQFLWRAVRNKLQPIRLLVEIAGIATDPCEVKKNPGARTHGNDTVLGDTAAHER